MFYWILEQRERGKHKLGSESSPQCLVTGPDRVKHKHKHQNRMESTCSIGYLDKEISQSAVEKGKHKLASKK